MQLIDTIKDIVTKYVSVNRLELVDISLKKTAGRMVLKILMDKPLGITLDECAEVNSYLSGILDEKQIINSEYVIEVSSPGLDRPLKTMEDFKRALGKNIKISTYAPIDGENVFVGELAGLNKDAVVLKHAQDSVAYEIAYDKIARAKLFFDSGLKKDQR